MRILLVEDNEKLIALLSDSLRQAGFTVDESVCAEDAYAALDVASYDLVILDLGLPDEDGMDVLKTMRSNRNSVPVLILTARDMLDQKIKGLNAGADDYMTKPFESEELVARVRALMRRPAQSHDIYLRLGRVIYDTVARQAEAGGELVRLSNRETSLLEIMMRASGKIVTKENLEMQLYGYDEEGSANSVEVLVHRLRKKLDQAKADVLIHTLRGIGYMMTDKEHGQAH